MESSTSAYNSVNAFQNPNNFGRFQVLKDKTFTLQNPNASFDATNIEMQGLVKPFKFTHKFKKPIVVRFNATNGGTFADIVDNSWHVIGQTNNLNLAPSISYVSKVYYCE